MHKPTLAALAFLSPSNGDLLLLLKKRNMELKYQNISPSVNQCNCQRGHLSFKMQCSFVIVMKFYSSQMGNEHN
jgi:hypothetical protein